MIILNDNPCNGIDLSHYNTDSPVQPWVKFFGHKTIHLGGSGMVSGVDPKFAARRLEAQKVNTKWRAFYMYLVPTTTAKAILQVSTLTKAIVELQPGESVYLDWEHQGVTRAMIDEFTIYMNIEFPGRWFMYVNDNTQESLAWMNANKTSDALPMMLPDYTRQGFEMARKWNATVWQCGQGTPPGFVGSVPYDYVLRPNKLDIVCGRV
jgi:hypothetical protein